MSSFIADKVVMEGLTFDDVLHNISAPICIDYAHTNHRGYKIAADYIYNNFYSQLITIYGVVQ